MKTIILLYLSCLLLCSSSMAKTISDINKEDANYKAIQQSITQGYLSLYNNNEFKPNTSLSRRDAAIIINKLTPQLSNTPALSSVDYDDLQQLSISFKDLYINNQNTLSKVTKNQTLLFHETTTLHHDINTLQNDIQSLKKERKLLYILLASSTLLGFVFP